MRCFQFDSYRTIHGLWNRPFHRLCTDRTLDVLVVSSLPCDVSLQNTNAGIAVRNANRRGVNKLQTLVLLYAVLTNMVLISLKMT